MIVEFTVNNKTYSATKIFLFMANYGRELRIEADIKRKRKMEKTMEFAERIKKIQKNKAVALSDMQNLDTNFFI